MESFTSNIQIRVHDSIFLKNPETSKLGINIICGSIQLLDELGFEDFTFKKLATAIQSTEASIYRYFESKHQLLTYLASWYWGWVEYKLIFGLANIESPENRLKKSLRILTEPVEQDSNFSHINEVKLNQIIIREFSKIYLNSNVDKDNKIGYFLAYKNVVSRVSDIVSEVDPSFKYPHMLISTIIEGAHHQRFFAEHLPRLTDTVEGEDAVITFYTQLVFNTISHQ